MTVPEGAHLVIGALCTNAAHFLEGNPCFCHRQKGTGHPDGKTPDDQRVVDIVALDMVRQAAVRHGDGEGILSSRRLGHESR